MQVSDKKVSPFPKIELNTPSLPKGGGAMRGISDNLKTNAFTGTAQYSIEMPLTSARGFDPSCVIGYNSGGGNSPFGLGFSFFQDSIHVKTERGIPSYDGTENYKLASEGELIKKDETLFPDAFRKELRDNISWDVQQYLPRIQELYSKIEKWTNTTDCTAYWVVTTANNVQTIFGKTENARIYNPKAPAQITEWLPEESTDAKGNKIVYAYKKEDDANVPEVIYEQNRSITANRYISRISYGNYFDGADEKFAFEVVFDYGEYDVDDLKKPGIDPYKPVRPWLCRSDPFSTYKSGFEIRTYRLCKNILLFHLFKKEVGDPCLVTRLALQYQSIQEYNGIQINLMSQLTGAITTGCQRKADGSYYVQDMPRVDLNYSAFCPPAAPNFLTLSMSDVSIPGYINTSQFLPVDLNGEGLDGLLYSNDETTLYLEPLGEGKYSLPDAVTVFPIDKNIQDGSVRLTDLDGNGKMDMLIMNEQRAGYYPLNNDGSWGQFQAFSGNPLNASDVFIEMTDVDANGKTDLLLATSQDIWINYSKGYNGFDPAKQVLNNTQFPVKPIGSAGQLVTFTDIFGDGLSHRVSIRPGLIECWPCLGHGYYGEKVTLDNAPLFGNALDTSRLYLTDIDGSGLTDLAYVFEDRIELYLNENGNRFADPITIYLPALYSAIAQINFMDVRGDGTNCLVLTVMSPEPVHYYYAFTGTNMASLSFTDVVIKPYLLTSINNGMGMVTEILYASSTKFMLEDKRKGRPWLTRLRFPVQVVEKKTVYDLISKTVACNRWKYHDGYYDTADREFRGFGFVESWDTDTLEKFEESLSNPAFPVKRINEELYIPPVYTKEWYNTGAFMESEAILKQYKTEYFQGDPDACDFPATVFQNTIFESDATILAQAYAALKGKLIRQEIYSEDGSDLASNPYTVTETNYQVEMLQGAGKQKHAVFTSYPREKILYHYERNPSDPSIRQSFIFETDQQCGKPKRSCLINLPRRNSADPTVIVYPEQQLIRASAETTGYINSTDDKTYYYRGVEYEQQEFELTGLDLKGNSYFSFDTLKPQFDNCLSNIIPYLKDASPTALEAHQLGWSQCYFWNDDQTEALPAGEIGARSLLYSVSSAVFTNENLPALFGAEMNPTLLEELGGYYFYNDLKYWVNRGLVQHYENTREKFYVPFKTENSFVADTSPLFVKNTAEYDSYHLRIIKSTEWLNGTTGNSETFVWNYQSMQPIQVTDINKNVYQQLYDPLGQPIVTSLFGKEKNQPLGCMRLYAYDGQPAEYILRETNKDGKPIQIGDVLLDPEYYLQGASIYFFYDLVSNKTMNPVEAEPMNTLTLSRENYFDINGVKTKFSCRQQIGYWDGMNRKVQQKDKVNTGKAIIRDPDMKLVYHAGKPMVAVSEERWKVSGRVVYNNKGEVCESYFPYFSSSAYFETQDEIVNEGLVAPPTITHYDPLLRPIRIDTPKAFFTKSVITSWQVADFDENDTILDSAYYRDFMKNYPANPTQAQQDEWNALNCASKFNNTPAIQILNNAGQVFLQIANNLGQVAPNAFDKITSGTTITSQEIWSDLGAKGYLDKDGWPTTKFAPYSKGFQLQLDPRYASFVKPVGDLLRQELLTSRLETDRLGRVTEAIDPRLYYSNINGQTGYFNFRYYYPMQAKTQSCRDSADAGKEFHLLNIFGNQCWSLSARGYNQVIIYDRLLRTSELRVKQIDSNNPIPYSQYPLLEQFFYGESEKNAEQANLRGELIKKYDLAGIEIFDQYSMLGEVLKQSRQLNTDYKNPIEWADPPKVKMDAEVYVTSASFDALNTMTQLVLPDKTATNFDYHIDGTLNSLSMQYDGDDNEVQHVVNAIEYDASGQRLSVKYGNSVTTTYDIEHKTLRLLRLKSVRPQNSRNDADGMLQDITYVYDPVGNITTVRDLSQTTVFNNNQKIDPVNKYTYDAIYRLINSSGRQHPGILATTYRNNTKDNDFKQSKFSSLPADESSLEIYSEQYAYDDSSNLVCLQHTAPSASWNRQNPVKDDSNRLKNFEYDASGNLRQLQINDTVSLSYNCCENLVKTGIIERPGENSDCDYYNYDSNNVRIRKVTERLANGNTTEIEEKIYLGNYEIKRVKRTVNGKIDAGVISERQTLRVMDAGKCALVVHFIKDDTNRPVNTGMRQLRWQLQNLIGSVAMELTTDAQIISYEEYYPYGGTSIIAGSSKAEVSLKDYRYMGKERDDSTGLYYYGARYYAPWLMRWLNADPAGTVDGLNLFEFVSGNPIVNRDDDGMAKKKMMMHGVQRDKPPSHIALHTRVKLIGIRIGKDIAAGKLGDIHGRPLRLAKIIAIKKLNKMSVQNDKKVMDAIDAGMAGDHGTFDKLWHKAHGAMDEKLSTITVFHLLRGIKIGMGVKTFTPKQHAAVNGVIAEISSYRMKTSHTGFSTANGTVQHTTGVPFWGSSGLNHGLWDRLRRFSAVVAGEKSGAVGVGILDDTLKGAVRFDLNYGVAPATASNVNTLPHITAAEKIQQAKEREVMKEMAREAGIPQMPGSQLSTAPWNPRDNETAPLSPRRIF